METGSNDPKETEVEIVDVFALGSTFPVSSYAVAVRKAEVLAHTKRRWVPEGMELVQDGVWWTVLEVERVFSCFGGDPEPKYGLRIQADKEPKPGTAKISWGLAALARASQDFDTFREKALPRFPAHVRESADAHLMDFYVDAKAGEML